MSTLLLGLGNRDRGDDGVGLLVSDRLRGCGIDADVIAWEGADVDLPLLWEGYDRVVVVDAAAGALAPGAIRHLGLADLHAAAPPAGATHALGLGRVVGLAAALDRLPATMDVWTIEVACVDHGTGLSAPVARAADRLVRRLSRELRWVGAGTVPPAAATAARSPQGA